MAQALGPVTTIDSVKRLEQFSRLTTLQYLRQLVVTSVVLAILVE